MSHCNSSDVLSGFSGKGFGSSEDKFIHGVRLVSEVDFSLV